MSYDYQAQRAGIFTESGMQTMLKVRDRIKHLVDMAGAFRVAESGLGSWEELACIDYLVEIGELVEFKRECWGQFRVLTTPQVSNA